MVPRADTKNNTNKGNKLIEYKNNSQKMLFNVKVRKREE